MPVRAVCPGRGVRGRKLAASFLAGCLIRPPPTKSLERRSSERSKDSIAGFAVLAAAAHLVRITRSRRPQRDLLPTEIPLYRRASKKRANGASSNLQGLPDKSTRVSMEAPLNASRSFDPAGSSRSFENGTAAVPTSIYEDR